MRYARLLAFVAVLIVPLMTPYGSRLVTAAPSEHLNWGSALSSGADACPPGNLVINVKQRVLTDVDSGVAGNFWAFDDFVRGIQVVQIGPSTFCATVKYQGQFTTIAGIAPAGKGTVGAGVVGTFEGGYVSTVFTATLLSKPFQRAMGSIGTFDYNCDASGHCPGYSNWTAFYFTAISGFDLAWWGWVYHAGNNGSWVNSIVGNSGNITGN
jgi:hypothetical protein